MRHSGTSIVRPLLPQLDGVGGPLNYSASPRDIHFSSGCVTSAVHPSNCPTEQSERAPLAMASESHEICPQLVHYLYLSSTRRGRSQDPAGASPTTRIFQKPINGIPAAFSKVFALARSSIHSALNGDDAPLPEASLRRANQSKESGCNATVLTRPWCIRRVLRQESSVAFQKLTGHCPCFGALLWLKAAGFALK